MTMEIQLQNLPTTDPYETRAQSEAKGAKGQGERSESKRARPTDRSSRGRHGPHLFPIYPSKAGRLKWPTRITNWVCKTPL